MKRDPEIGCEGEVLDDALDGVEVGLCCSGDARCKCAVRETNVWTNGNDLKDESKKFSLASDVSRRKEWRVVVGFVGEC